MPDEIPDSDENSDYEPAPRETPRPLPQAGDTQRLPIASDRGLDVNFDDFISQSQSAKDGSSQLEQTKRSTASTQKYLREALDNRRQSVSSSYDGADDMESGAKVSMQPREATGQRKRAHSEVDTGHNHSGPSQSRNKRTNTYGSSSRLLVLSQGLERYHEAVESADTKQMAFPSASNERLSSRAPGQEDDDEDIVPRARNRARRVVSLLDDTVSDARKILSTTNSSIGGYQSINMNFRGSASGLDINANPFGSLSQISVDADAENTVEQQRAELSSTVPLSASPRQPGRDAFNPLTDSGLAPHPTADTEISVDPSVLTFEQPAETQKLTSPIAISAIQRSMNTLTTASSLNPDDTGEDLSTNLVSDIGAHTESERTTKGRGSKSGAPRKASIRSTHDELPEQEDLQGLAVGLPKEQYKPRPSKSRGGTVEPDHESQQDHDELPPTKKQGRKKSIKSASKAAEQSSPAKLPTSELNLSDEAIIGLPRENYQPRPTRRRSRMVVEEDAGIVAEVEARSQQSPSIDVQSQQSNTIQVKVPTPTQKTKKGKKAKVKRAKTSAAGLLKKSAPMISDGEEDVVWMDTKPAKVKLDLPPDPLAGKGVKEEDPAADEMTVDQKQSSQRAEKHHVEAMEASHVPRKTLTVEIPARAEKEISSPKKRGRKRKQTAEVIEDEEPDVEAEVEAQPSISTPINQHPSSQNSTRESTILQEKNTSTLLPPTPAAAKEATPSPTKPTSSKPVKITHSPINPTGGKVLFRVGLSRRSAIPPLLKIVKPPAKQQAEKENFDEDGKPVDLVAETMRKWREMGALD
jgi:hypothetical protein